MRDPAGDGVLISIITPCYNGARFIERTLRSAASQTRPPMEILVVDDGSTDESAQIAEAFGAPVRVIRQANQGESVARNRALAEARGTHVLFLDADDLLEPTSLARLAEAVAGRTGAVALMGCAWFAEDPAAPYTTKLPAVSAFYPDIIQSNLAPPHCWLAPIGVVREAGGFCEEMRWFEDWDLWWRVGLVASALVPVAHVGALYRRHPQSQLATTKMVDRAGGHAALMGRMGAAFLDRPEMLERHGDRLFWSCFAALSRARAAGVPWDELEPLSSAIVQIARRGPAAARGSRFARAVRWIGVRPATALHATLIGAPEL